MSLKGKHQPAGSMERFELITSKFFGMSRQETCLTPFIVSPGAGGSTSAAWAPSQLIVHFFPKASSSHLLVEKRENYALVEPSIYYQYIKKILSFKFNLVLIVNCGRENFLT